VQLQLLARTVADRGIRLEWAPEVKRFLAGRGYDPTFGARPLKRLIQKDVTDALARKLLNGELGPGDTDELELSADQESIEVVAHRVTENATTTRA